MSILERAGEGRFNVHYTLAGGIGRRAHELSSELDRERFADFQHVQHRLEVVATIEGVRYVNDSGAFTVNATWYALAVTEAPIVWIAGGDTRKAQVPPITELVSRDLQKVRAMYVLSKDPGPWVRTFSDHVPSVVPCASMTEAVTCCYRTAERGDTVLLSPAQVASSRYTDHAQRGWAFRQAVLAL